MKNRNQFFTDVYSSPSPIGIRKRLGWEGAAPQANHFHLQIDESYTTEKISATQSAK